MRIGVIGGGPGGLYFARLMRRLSPDCEVHVYERNTPDSTFGFGVAFSQKTLHNLEAADQDTHAAILRESIGWDGMAMRHTGREVRWAGFGLDAISRTALLALLHQAARDVGVRLHFEQPVMSADLKDFDVIVAADGANSLTRDSYNAAFRPTVKLGQARYMWLGSTGPFERTTFSVRCNEAGTFAIHAYPYARSRATLVAETDEATWRRAGFAAHADAASASGASDEWSAKYLADLFARDLAGHGLLLNNSKWLRFPSIRNERWSTGNLVLLGDAAHTAHPSVASGTKLAMEDAIALAEELSDKPDLDRAFAAYETRRRPDVEHVQRRAALSQRWWETVHHRAGLPPEQLALSYVTRAGAVDYAKLEKLAPTLTRSARQNLSSSDMAPVTAPLHIPVTIAGRRLNGRLVTDVPGATSSAVQLIRGRDDYADAAELMEAVRKARVDRPEALIAAELPQTITADGVDGSTGIDLLTALRDAGCDLVAVPHSPSDAVGLLAERARLDLGLPVLARCAPDELDRAATDVLAGRIDLVLITAEDPVTTTVHSADCRG